MKFVVVVVVPDRPVEGVHNIPSTAPSGVAVAVMGVDDPPQIFIVSGTDIVPQVPGSPVGVHGIEVTETVVIAEHPFTN
jgi:hypothetical protein